VEDCVVKKARLFRKISRGCAFLANVILIVGIIIEPSQWYVFLALILVNSFLLRRNANRWKETPL